MSKTAIMTALVAALALPAVADETKIDSNGERYRLLNCYQKVTVPAQFRVTKELVKKPERKYVKKGNMIELREYPAVYREIRTKIRDEYIVMKEVVCKPDAE
ncbi:hypothetical protein [Pseudaestuariivita atlantica]|uniref:Uncharacterized protein n=1 Tax=Pseudaestuariivita atlantica TaxID=1317121 RepID=A0A0L1JMC0_9RHOB|nr:hypothetical protein [Pseudaestuariivita atlantica]KNG92867.1 hypothetical protein ATO11_15510 [Pseudaestuariivita atlantica]